MRYLKPEPESYGPNPDYWVEDGIVKDDTEVGHPNARRFEGDRMSKAEMLNEEAEWAARSGPVVVKRKGRG